MPPVPVQMLIPVRPVNLQPLDQDLVAIAKKDTTIITQNLFAKVRYKQNKKINININHNHNYNNNNINEFN